MPHLPPEMLGRPIMHGPPVSPECTPSERGPPKEAPKKSRPPKEAKKKITLLLPVFMMFHLACPTRSHLVIQRLSYLFCISPLFSYHVCPLEPPERSGINHQPNLPAAPSFSPLMAKHCIDCRRDPKFLTVRTDSGNPELMACADSAAERSVGKNTHTH